MLKGRRSMEISERWRPRQESNLYLALRRRSFYPLNYGGGVTAILQVGLEETSLVGSASILLQLLLTHDVTPPLRLLLHPLAEGLRTQEGGAYEQTKPRINFKAWHHLPDGPHAWHQGRPTCDH